MVFMPDEMQPNDAFPVAREASVAAAAPPAARQHWLLRNEKFLRAISMIGMYVFGALFLISLFALGTFAFISGILAGIFLCSLLMMFVLLKLQRLCR
jgi:hypothetical protein